MLDARYVAGVDASPLRRFLFQEEVTGGLAALGTGAGVYAIYRGASAGVESRESRAVEATHGRRLDQRIEELERFRDLRSRMEHSLRELGEAEAELRRRGGQYVRVGASAANDAVTSSLVEEVKAITARQPRELSSSEVTAQRRQAEERIAAAERDATNPRQRQQLANMRETLRLSEEVGKAEAALAERERVTQQQSRGGGLGDTITRDLLNPNTRHAARQELMGREMSLLNRVEEAHRGGERHLGQLDTDQSNRRRRAGVATAAGGSVISGVAGVTALPYLISTRCATPKSPLSLAEALRVQDILTTTVFGRCELNPNFFDISDERIQEVCKENPSIGSIAMSVALRDVQEKRDRIQQRREVQAVLPDITCVEGRPALNTLTLRRPGREVQVTMDSSGAARGVIQDGGQEIIRWHAAISEGRAMNSQVSISGPEVGGLRPRAGSGVTAQSLVLQWARSPEGRFSSPAGQAGGSPQEPQQNVALRHNLDIGEALAWIQEIQRANLCSPGNRPHHPRPMVPPPAEAAAAAR